MLVYGDPDESFNTLVRKHGGDVPARAMLDELTRVGTVSNENGRVTLLQKGYVPHESESALLDLFATSATDLLTTLDHNLAGTGERRLQMSVAYDNVTAAGVETFRTLSAERGIALLRELDAVLRQHDLDADRDDADSGDANPASSGDEAAGDGGRRIGLGLYLIEDMAETDDADDD